MVVSVSKSKCRCARVSSTIHYSIGHDALEPTDANKLLIHCRVGLNHSRLMVWPTWQRSFRVSLVSHDEWCYCFVVLLATGTE
jgi:hypothetical protein